jgi:hypothetical protein
MDRLKADFIASLPDAASSAATLFFDVPVRANCSRGQKAYHIAGEREVRGTFASSV